MTEDQAAPAPADPAPAAAPAAAPFLNRALTRSARHGNWLLALAALILWLPGILSLPALDRDESRFAQSSRQMLDSGNYVDIRFGQVPRYKKPAGIYWLQAATTAVAGLGQDRRIWTYRLPSLLGGIAALLLTFWAAGGAELGLIAGRLLVATLLLTAEATMATTDAALLAATTAMMAVLMRVYRAAKEDAPPPSTKLVLLGWAAMAAGILLKGPVAPAVAAATIAALIAWDRDWKWLKQTKPLAGLGVTLLICAPWALAIAIQSHGAFFQQSLGGDFAAKVAGGQEGHGAPPGYYLLFSAVTLWPSILFVLPGIGLGFTRRKEPMIRFLLAWAGAWWLAVELVPTKLPNYVLPALPPLLILSALWMLAPPEKEKGWRRVLPWIAALQFFIGLVLVTAAPAQLPKYYAALPAPIWPAIAAAAALLAGLTALLIFLMGRRLVAAIPAVAASAILVLTLTAGVLPKLDQLWITDGLAALVAKDSKPGDPPPSLAGYEEPSLVFALGKDVNLTDGKGAAEWGASRGGLALVDDAEMVGFLARLAEMQASAIAMDERSGFNYSRGRPEHVMLYRVAPLAPVPTPLSR